MKYFPIIFSILLWDSLSAQIMQIERNAEALRITHEQTGHDYISFNRKSIGLSVNVLM